MKSYDDVAATVPLTLLSSFELEGADHISISIVELVHGTLFERYGVTTGGLQLEWIFIFE